MTTSPRRSTHGHSRPGSPSRLVPFALVAGLAALAGCAPADDPTATATPTLSVLTEPVAAVDGYEASRTYTGQVEALRESDVGFEVSGKLVSVRVDEGDRVAAGQVLAILDTDRLTARRAELRAALAEARAQADLARATLSRTDEAFQGRGVSRQALDEATNGAAARAAAVDLARARLESLDVEIAKSTLLAPFDAVVVARAVDEGAVLAAGQPLLSLQSTETPRARIGVAAAVAGRFAVGEVTTVTVEERSVQGRVAAVLARRDSATRTVDVLVDLVDTGDTVRPGDIARLTVTDYVAERGVWIPLGALAQGPRGLWVNYVAEQAPGEDAGVYRVTPRTVELLHAEAERAFVRGTLRDDDRLIVDGLQRIVPGQLVSLAGGGGDSARLAQRPAAP